ncbi:MAG: transposase [Nitrospira sp.]|nr:transposase [Nitrospira sp.]
MVYAIRQADPVTSIGDLCRQLEVSDANLYTWKKELPASGRERTPPGKCLLFHGTFQVSYACAYRLAISDEPRGIE